MDYVPAVFKTVSVTFSTLAIWTGANGLFRPAFFAADFGLPVNTTPAAALGGKKAHQPSAADNPTTRAYIALMGVRQLATGVILATFAAQGKWEEMATILATIGVLVAGIDGYFLASVAGRPDLGIFHALPGGAIALLSGLFLWQGT
ncbi:DUF4267 domain-containing protein [Microdochium nivale]|nr:DUF4267 domain-containing protein [Microdochium nivale]